MSSNNLPTICKRNHDNTDISDFYQIKRKNGDTYLRCKKCAKEDSKKIKQKNIAKARARLTRSQENLLNEMEELSNALELAMPWEKPEIKNKIKELQNAIV